MRPRQRWHSILLQRGTAVASRDLTTIGGEVVRIPEGDRLVHLQFRRSAGCPVCDLHLHSFVRRHDELARAGIRQVVVFHSTREDLLQYEADLPFAVVADADRRLYRDFGVESSPRAVLDPRAWHAIVRGVLHSVGRILGERRPIPPLRPRGGSLGLPADFLIAPDGQIVACKYGRHAADDWSVDDVLSLAVATRAGTKGKAWSAPAAVASGILASLGRSAIRPHALAPAKRSEAIVARSSPFSAADRNGQRSVSRSMLVRTSDATGLGESNVMALGLLCRSYPDA